jgi:hypothetical protein
LQSAVYVYDSRTGRRLQRLPLGIGTLRSVVGRKTSPRVSLSFTSYLSPTIVYLGEFASASSSARPPPPSAAREGGGEETTPPILRLREWRLPQIVGFQPADYAVQQVFVTSKDLETRVRVCLHSSFLFRPVL